ncbi:MAG: dTDP-4-dehydrorhamnose 3,5-epimerase [Bacteroidales bacterium]|jgi:dTDP-4-dehydrorhamnose 3,5-epimerase
MRIISTDIPEVFIIEPKVHGDSRGYFMESFIASLFEKEVCNIQFIQDNESSSFYGVLRGLHYQLSPHCQSKLLRVVSGRIMDVAVDIRIGSPTFGKHVALELSADNKRQLFIPKGFAHGFSVLSNQTIVQYKTDNLYAPEYERAIRWDDPDLNINWGLPSSDIILSEKDKKNPFLMDAPLFDYNQKLY